MKETVTVTVRTDSEGVTGRGRGSLSPVLSGFVPIAAGHGVATQDPDDLTGGTGDDRGDQGSSPPAERDRDPSQDAGAQAEPGQVAEEGERGALRDDFDAAVEELGLAVDELMADEEEPPANS